MSPSRSLARPAWLPSDSDSAGWRDQWGLCSVSRPAFLLSPGGCKSADSWCQLYEDIPPAPLTLTHILFYDAFVNTKSRGCLLVFTLRLSSKLAHEFSGMSSSTFITMFVYSPFSFKCKPQPVKRFECKYFRHFSLLQLHGDREAIWIFNHIRPNPIDLPSKTFVKLNSHWPVIARVRRIVALAVHVMISVSRPHHVVTPPWSRGDWALARAVATPPSLAAGLTSADGPWHPDTRWGEWPGSPGVIWPEINQGSAPGNRSQRKLQDLMLLKGFFVRTNTHLLVVTCNMKHFFLL